MRPLATNIPAGSQWLFGGDLNEKIAQISSMNNALSQTFKSNRVGIITVMHQHTINNIKSQKTTALQEELCYVTLQGLGKGENFLIEKVRWQF